MKGPVLEDETHRIGIGFRWHERHPCCRHVPNINKVKRGFRDPMISAVFRMQTVMVSERLAILRMAG